MAQEEAGGAVRWNPRSQRWERTAAAESGGPESGPGPGPGVPPPEAAYPPGTPPRPEEAPAWAAGGYGRDPWAAPAEASVPAPARRRWTLVAVALGVAVLGAAAVAGWLLLAGGSGGGDGGGSGGEGPAAVPAGYTRVHDTANGFSVAVPTDWQTGSAESGYGTVYGPAGAAARTEALQVFRVTEDTIAACDYLRTSVEPLSQAPGYRDISREPLASGGCEQVYGYDDPNSSEPAAHAIARLTVAADGTRWVLLTYGPDTDVPLVRKRLTTAVDTFRTGAE